MKKQTQLMMLQGGCAVVAIIGFTLNGEGVQAWLAASIVIHAIGMLAKETP